MALKVPVKGNVNSQVNVFYVYALLKLPCIFPAGKKV